MIQKDGVKGARGAAALGEGTDDIAAPEARATPRGLFAAWLACVRARPMALQADIPTRDWEKSAGLLQTASPSSTVPLGAKDEARPVHFLRGLVAHKRTHQAALHVKIKSWEAEEQKAERRRSAELDAKLLI